MGAHVRIKQSTYELHTRTRWKSLRSASAAHHNCVVGRNGSGKPNFANFFDVCADEWPLHLAHASGSSFCTRGRGGARGGNAACCIFFFLLLALIKSEIRIQSCYEFSVPFRWRPWRGGFNPRGCHLWVCSFNCAGFDSSVLCCNSNGTPTALGDSAIALTLLCSNFLFL